MAEGKVFFGGVPTGPDVELLKKAIKLEPGDLIAHEQIEKVIEIGRKTSRYRSVVSAWKKTIEREKHQRMDAEVGVGYRVLTPEQAISKLTKDIEGITNASIKTTVRAEVINTVGLPDQVKSEHALVRRRAHMINDACRQARKEIAEPQPTMAVAARLVK